MSNFEKELATRNINSGGKISDFVQTIVQLFITIEVQIVLILSDSLSIFGLKWPLITKLSEKSYLKKIST